MKKITKFFIAIFIGIAISVSASFAAKQYCHEPITSGTNTIYLSCETPSTGNYRITIESDVAMTNLSSGCYCNINGVGGSQLINLAGYNRSSDGKKITIDIPSSSAPNLYTPLYILMPAEVNFGTWPSDIDWTGTCIPGGIPTLTTTTAVSAITATTAISGGNISNIGSSAITVSGVCWGTTTGPTVTLATKTTDGPLASGTFTSNITGLANGVKYYVRSYATNTQGTAYGPEVSFIALDTEIPTAFTAVKGAVTTTSIELLLNATDNSGSISYSVSYGTTSTTAIGVSGTQKSLVISGLVPLTNYTFIISATDASGNAAVNSPISVSATTTAYPIAPTPTVAATNVIGIYSDAYTCVANTFQWWAASSGTDLVQGGNNFKNITSTNCFGTQVTALQDVSSMKYLHVDIYSTTLTTIQIGIVAPAGNECHPANTLIPNQWNSFDISLADLKSAKPSLDLTKLTQVGFWGMNGTFYLDNIYFWTDVAPSLAVSTTALTIEQPATSTNTFDITTTSGWTVASDQIWLTPSSTNGTGNATITLTAATANTAYAPRTANVTISGSGTTKTIVVTQNPLMPSAAPVPTFDASKVISIFSDTYTNVAGTNFYPGWGQSTVATQVNLSGNTAMEYTNFNYQGIELGNQVDASAMNKLHVDIYPTTETTINVSPINTSKAGALKEGSASLGTLIANQWNSINIALSTIGVDMSAMDQFIFKGGSNGTFYMDNLYLYNDLSTSISEVATSTGITCYPNPIITNFTVSAKAEINQVIIRNLLGQSVKSIMMNGLTRTIDLSDIASGNYFITVKLANGQLSTQKILKL